MAEGNILLRHRLVGLTAALPLFFLLTAAAKVQHVSAVKDARDPDTCLSLEEVSYAPGEASKSHHHEATVIAYVLAGSIDSKVGDEPLRTYRPGQSWVELAGVEHWVSRNASKTEPATFLAVLLTHRGRNREQPCDG